MTGGGLALLSQEGSVIETQSRSREGRFQSHMLKGVVSEPPLAASRNARDAAALLTQEGKELPACRFIHTFIDRAYSCNE